jgi:AcrR family transcriptional regulator
MEFNEKQLQILDNAERLFADKGYDGTSVRDIADEAGVNVAMISYYFGSKEKLLEALFNHRSAGASSKVKAIMENTEMGPMEKVEAMIDYYIDKFQNENCFHKIMMREQVAIQRTTTASLILDFKKRNQELVSKLIQDGQKAGVFVKNIDVPISMATLIGTVSHMFTTQHFYREVNNLQSLTDEQFQKHIRKKISTHMKFLFKAILTHEA